MSRGFWRKFNQNENFLKYRPPVPCTWSGFDAQPVKPHRKDGPLPHQHRRRPRQLQAENPGWDFDAVPPGRDAWNWELSKVKVDMLNEDGLINFYTALYHTYLGPTTYADVDGSYRGIDQNNHRAEAGRTTVPSPFGIPIAPCTRFSTSRSLPGTPIWSARCWSTTTKASIKCCRYGATRAMRTGA